jgi:hypothetical protein
MILTDTPDNFAATSASSCSVAAVDCSAEIPFRNRGRIFLKQKI